MVQMSTLRLQRRGGEFLRWARREPVEILHHGKREFVLMSAEHYDWLRATVKRAHRTVDAPQHVVDAVERAEMDPKKDALGELLASSDCGSPDKRSAIRDF